MSRLRAIALAACLAVLASCAPSESRVTQVLVTVNADSQIIAQLESVEVLLYSAFASDGRTPAREQRFALRSSGSERVHGIPFSFGISREGAELFALIVRGCGPGVGCTDVVVEQKQLVRFLAGRTTQIDVLLTTPCERASARCVGLETTCAPLATEVTPAGACVPVTESTGAVVIPTDIRFPMLPEPERRLDAGPPAIDPIKVPDAAPLDAGALGPEDSGTGDVSAAPPLSPACPADHTCGDEYPCIRDQGEGYVCRGQLADWPMPDTLPGAKQPARYEVVVPGEVVRDLVTGLEWQQREPESYAGCTGAQTRKGDTCSWQEAKSYCENLSLANRRWRLPSKIELESLLDARATIASLDSDLFFVTPLENHWTASSLPWVEDEQAYIVNFMLNHVGAISKALPSYVRCVHSADTPPRAVGDRFDERAIELLLADRRTGLSWQHPTFSYCKAVLPYEEALRYCTEFDVGFRLPSVKELLTLVDPSKRRPAIVDAFKATTPEAGWYWSTTTTRNGSEHLVVGSQIGGVAPESQAPLRDAEASYCVRCVK
jgi:hypothetical protein